LQNHENPSYLLKYDILTNKLSEIIKSKDIREMQNILDGKKLFLLKIGFFIRM